MLRIQFTHVKIIAILLQETRVEYSLASSRTCQKASITHKCKGQQQPLAIGQATLLIRNDCVAVEADIPHLGNDVKEIVAVAFWPAADSHSVCILPTFHEKQHEGRIAHVCHTSKIRSWSSCSYTKKL